MDFIDIMNGGKFGIGKKFGFGKKSGGFSKWFFITIIICTLAYLSLQIKNSSYDKKYVVALLVIYIFSIVGGLFIDKIPGIGPFGIFIILKIIFLGGPLLTIFILNILLGKGSF